MPATTVVLVAIVGESWVRPSAAKSLVVACVSTRLQDYHATGQYKSPLVEMVRPGVVLKLFGAVVELVELPSPSREHGARIRPAPSLRRSRV